LAKIAHQLFFSKIKQIMKIFDGKLKLESKSVVARELLKMKFSVVPPDFTFRAGQFLSLDFGENKWRAYSIASAPREKEIEFVVRLVPNGIASEKFRNSKVGDEFPFKGPFSDFGVDEGVKEIVFCATGTGIASIKSMIMDMKGIEDKKIKLLYGGRDEEDLPYLEEVKEWVNENFEVFLGFSQGIDEKRWAGEKFISAENCRITKFLEEQNFSDECSFYLCGSGRMVQSVCDILAEKGIRSERVFFEAE